MRKLDDRNPLDDAIDRAVLEIMSADTRPAFRHRVLARIQPRWHQRSWFRWPAFAGAMLMLFGIVSSVVYRSSTHDPADVPQIVARPPVAPGPSPVAPRVEPSASVVSETPRPAARRRPPRATEPSSDSIFGPPTNRVTAASIDRAGPMDACAAAEAAAASPPEERGIRPIGILPAIVVAPIEIAPIRLAPPRQPR